MGSHSCISCEVVSGGRTAVHMRICLFRPRTIYRGLRSSVSPAIKEFSDLGSGFRVAALDLEIRGAGNLLGAEQSGRD